MKAKPGKDIFLLNGRRFDRRINLKQYKAEK
jgi:hypothetical protein